MDNVGDEKVLCRNEEQIQNVQIQNTKEMLQTTLLKSLRQISQTFQNCYKLSYHIGALLDVKTLK